MKPADLANRKVKSIANNKKAWHDFEVVSKLETGIVLTGTEVKSLRAGKCNFMDAYATFLEKDNFDLYLLNFHISPYDHGNRENHEPKRMRKLLISLREGRKLKQQVTEKGLTIIPLSIYFSGPFVKVEIGLVRAKKNYDKREDMKEKDSKREIERKFRV
jgi:SsrA-binding protein